MTLVKERAKKKIDRHFLGRVPNGGSCEAAQGWEWSVETTVDQALIRGLATAFRCYVSGLSSV
jgi:hypothetical protein